MKKPYENRIKPYDTLLTLRSHMKPYENHIKTLIASLSKKGPESSKRTTFIDRQPKWPRSGLEAVHAKSKLLPATGTAERPLG